MNKRKIKIELEGYEIERIRRIINAIKEFNIATSYKADIEYDTIRELDGGDNFVARHFGLYQPSVDADYQWVEEENS